MLPSASQPGDGPGVGLVQPRPVAAQQIDHHAFLERPQHQAAAARADGRQDASRAVGDDQHQGAARRLLEHLQDGIGARPVQLVDRIEDDHPPAAVGRRQGQEGADAAHVVDGNLAFQAGHLVVGPAALDHPQIGVRPGRDMADGRMVGRDVEGLGGPQQAPTAAPGEHEAGHAIGQRRLADPARAADQPGMGHPLRGPGLGEGGLCRRVAKQQRIGAGRKVLLVHRQAV
jgi:hypothetical protein